MQLWVDESFIAGDHNLFLAYVKHETAVGAAAGIQSCNGNTYFDIGWFMLLIT